MLMHSYMEEKGNTEEIIISFHLAFSAPCKKFCCKHLTEPKTPSLQLHQWK